MLHFEYAWQGHKEPQMPPTSLKLGKGQKEKGKKKEEREQQALPVY